MQEAKALSYSKQLLSKYFIEDEGKEHNGGREKQGTGSAVLETPSSTGNAGCL